MKKTFYTLLSIFLFCSFQFQETDPLKNLYERYKLGEISECQLDGTPVYLASINAFDAPVIVYDELGKKLFTCNYAWGQADAACQELDKCAVVYRCKMHISGKRSVDKYELAK